MNLGLHLEHACGGSCACTTCHLFVKQGVQNLSEPQDNELDRLDTAWDLRPESRLGCQAVIKGDVVVEFPLYTRNYVQEGGDIQLGKSGNGVGSHFSPEEPVHEKCLPTPFSRFAREMDPFLRQRHRALREVSSARPIDGSFHGSPRESNAARRLRRRPEDLE